MGRAVEARLCGGEQLLDFLWRNGPRVQESLALVALLALQLDELGLVLDALGQGVEPEGLAELDEGLQQRPPAKTLLPPRARRG